MGWFGAPKNPYRVTPALWFDVAGDPATPNPTTEAVAITRGAGSARSGSARSVATLGEGAGTVNMTVHEKGGVYRNADGHAMYLAEGTEVLPTHAGYAYDAKATKERLDGRERSVGAAPDNRARDPKREAEAEERANAKADAEERAKLGPLAEEPAKIKTDAAAKA